MKILVKVEYHGQVWFEEIDMKIYLEQVNGTLQEGRGNLPERKIFNRREAPQRSSV